MKKLLAVAVAAFTLFANAEWKTVGTIQVADSITLAQSVSKLGEFTGNMMIGMMAAGALNDLPGMAVFGPGRKGAATLYPFFVENGQYEFAVLYPVAITKTAFLKKYPDAVESNGLIRVKCPLITKMKLTNYAAFSQDGKWVGISDKPQQARLALKEIAIAEKAMDGDMLKIRINRRGLDEFVRGGEQEKEANVKDVIAQLKAIGLGVRVSDKGLDLRCAVKTVAGSELAKIGCKPLGAKPLAFAQQDAIFSFASAENCGYQSVEQRWSELRPLLEKSGVKLDWLEFVQKNITSKFTIDLGKLFVWVKTQEGKGDSDVLGKAFAECKQYFDSKKKDKVTATGPAINCEFALKGYAGKYLPAQRFTYTLPEIAKKKPFAVGFFSLYSLIRAVVPVMAKEAPEECAGIETVLAALPEEGQGGMAYMAWADKDAMGFFLRIGADEFKAVSAGFAAFTSLSSRGGSDSSVDDVDVDSDDLTD